MADVRITERALFLPTLHFIDVRPGANTTALIGMLLDFFHPVGKDAERINNRSDTHFSQKVRNLLGSHYATNGFSDLAQRVDDGFVITDKGRRYLEVRNEFLHFLLDNQFSYYDILPLLTPLPAGAKTRTMLNNTKIYYSENDTIQEGLSSEKNTVAKQRSKELREFAVNYYKAQAADKKLHCHVCDFCFEDVYRDLGIDFIEIHHQRPLFQYPEQGIEQYLSEAVQNVKPVCSNCHRMLHRNRKEEPLSIEDLRKIIIRG